MCTIEEQMYSCIVISLFIKILQFEGRKKNDIDNDDIHFMRDEDEKCVYMFYVVHKQVKKKRCVLRSACVCHRKHELHVGAMMKKNTATRGSEGETNRKR